MFSFFQKRTARVTHVTAATATGRVGLYHRGYGLVGLYHR